jgi:hypothetical protein
MSTNVKKIFALLALACLLNFAAACSKDTQQSQEEEEQERQEKETAEAKAAAETYKPKLICPQVAIIHELDTVRDYGGAQPASAQLVAAARMNDITGDCGYQDEGIDIAFQLNFTAARGPHLAGNRMQFPFFVAVVDPDGNILNKNQMNEEFHFKDEDKTAEKSESMHVFIPMPKDKHQTGPNYRVLAGFQLTEDQLKQVRAAESKAETVAQPASPASGNGIMWR